MKRLESSLTNMVLVLTGVAVVMGGILAWVNHLTEEPIARQKEQVLAEGIRTAMASPDVRVDRTDTVVQAAGGKSLSYVIYEVKDAQERGLGAVVASVAGGVGGALKVLVGFSPEGTIKGYTILEHAET